MKLYKICFSKNTVYNITYHTITHYIQSVIRTIISSYIMVMLVCTHFMMSECDNPKVQWVTVH